MKERRQGMDEFTSRLTRLETIAEAELGQDGRLHEDIAAVHKVVNQIDSTLRGDNGAGLGERIRKLERNQTFIITGLGAALAAAGRVGFEWLRTKLGGA